MFLHYIPTTFWMHLHPAVTHLLFNRWIKSFLFHYTLPAHYFASWTVSHSVPNCVSTNAELWSMGSRMVICSGHSQSHRWGSTVGPALWSCFALCQFQGPTQMLVAARVSSHSLTHLQVWISALCGIQRLHYAYKGVLRVTDPTQRKPQNADGCIMPKENVGHIFTIKSSFDVDEGLGAPKWRNLSPCRPCTVGDSASGSVR